jgi:type II secretory pathway pseudopilin PulG
MLLAILLMMALMIIVATYYVAPRMVQQIKRDRELEMIHRGTEYARAIKKFYKKNGRYPATLDDLDKGQVRFLRQRYKDPLSKDGKWKLLNYGDIATLLNAAGPGTPAAALGQGGTLTPGGALIGGVPSPTSGNVGSALQQLQQQILTTQGGQQQAVSNIVNSTNTSQGFGSQSSPGGSDGFSSGTDQGSSGSDQSSSNPGSSFGNSTGSGLGSSQPGASNQPGSAFGQNTTGGNQQFGGGAIVGVASLNKEKTIRIYNKKKTYDQWMFIYNPMMDVANTLLRGPYQPTTIGGSQIGTPAGQLNGQQQNGQQSPFGQQPGGLGQQPGGFGQQPGSGFGQQQSTPPQSPQSMQPNNGYPPEQNQQ